MHLSHLIFSYSLISIQLRLILVLDTLWFTRQNILRFLLYTPNHCKANKRTVSTDDVRKTNSGYLRNSHLSTVIFLSALKRKKKLIYHRL